MDDVMKLYPTARGHRCAPFTDADHAECSLVESATPAHVWLGSFSPWQEKQMHLSRAHVLALLPLLERFVATGELGGDP